MYEAATTKIKFLTFGIASYYAYANKYIIIWIHAIEWDVTDEYIHI